jgi:hypothetical protein
VSESEWLCERCGEHLPDHATVSQRWCSTACREAHYRAEREAVKAAQAGACRGCGASLAGKRAGAEWCSRTCRQRQLRRQAREQA